MIGQRIGNYQIVSLVGDGGMGTVYLGEHMTFGRKAAVKMLHSHLVRKEEIRNRFINEAKTLAKLNHPNIVALHDYVEQDDSLFLIMEYVAGRDLDELVKEEYGPLPTALLIDVFQQILDAMGYAHSQNIVHRDIKPSNFILSSTGRIKVLDFGIAKILDDTQAGMTKTGTRLGTAYYMSPEQVHGRKADQRSDIYSLGVLLFNLATGKIPYRDLSSEFEVYNEIVNHRLPPAKSMYPGIPARIEAIIQQATAKAPENRYQSCQEFREDIGKIGKGPSPVPQPAGEPPHRPASQIGSTKIAVNPPPIPSRLGQEPAPLGAQLNNLVGFAKRQKNWAIFFGILYLVLPGILFFLISGNFSTIVTYGEKNPELLNRHFKRFKTLLIVNIVLCIILTFIYFAGFPGLIYSINLLSRISSYQRQLTQSGVI